MIREEPELITDIRDFTTLFYVIFRRKSSKWSESSIESDLGMRFATLTKPFAILLSSTASGVRTGHYI